MIFIECKPDRVLVKFLIENYSVPIIHSGNKSGVCKKLEKNQNCVGLVDEDPGSVQPSYLNDLNLEFELNNLKLRVLKDNTKNNRLILLRPKLEDWIITSAKEDNVDVEPFGLSSNSNELHSIINNNLGGLIELIEFLKLRGNSKRLLILKKLLMGETI